MLVNSRGNWYRRSMTPQQIVGRRMRALRQAHGVTQEQLGASLEDFLGHPWSKQAVSAAENGQRDFNAPELFALAVIFGETVASIVTPIDPSERIAFPTGVEVEAGSLVGKSDGIPAQAASDLLTWALDQELLATRTVTYLQTLLGFPEEGFSRGGTSTETTAGMKRRAASAKHAGEKAKAKVAAKRRKAKA